MCWGSRSEWGQLCKRLGGCYTTAHFEEANEEGSVFLHSRIPLFSGPHVPHPKYNVISPTKANDLSSTLWISVVFLFCSWMLQKAVLFQTEVEERGNSAMGVDSCSSHMSLPFAWGRGRLQGTVQKASSKPIGLRGMCQRKQKSTSIIS